MRNLLLTLSVLGVLGVVSFAQSKQSYRLGWPHTQVMSGPAPRIQKDAPPAPVGRDQLPPSTSESLRYPEVVPQSRPPVNPRVAPEKVALVARHFFDFEKDSYVLVDRVETTIYRGHRYPHTQTHWNMGHISEFEVTLENLRRGDRFEAQVFWEDESSKRIERRVGERSERQILLDEPDAFTRK